MISRSLSLIAILAALFLAGPAHSQNQAAARVWQRVDQIPPNRPASDFWVRPTVFRSFTLDHAALKGVLARVPKETAQPVALSQTDISLPMPDGSLARFRIVESPVMAPELAAKFPEIKTYLGQGMDDPAASVRFDTTRS